MSKVVNCNVSGTPMDTPVIFDDVPRTWPGRFEPGNIRCVFELPDDAVGGGHLKWTDRQVNFLLPLAQGSFEGASLGLPTLAYASPATSLRIEGDRFKDWTWKGATDMALAARHAYGEDIRPILQQRKTVGANLHRVLAQVSWPWVQWGPHAFGDYFDRCRRFFDLLGETGQYCEWVVLATTRELMPTTSQQQAFWHQSIELARPYPFVLLELLNEYGHGSQSVDPSQFARPVGVLASHGSGLTDADTVRPLWDFATYHPRRDVDNARGFTNYDPFEFQADYPKPCPFIPDEGAKPESTGFNRDFFRRMGQHGKCGAGATYHTQAGVESRLWNDGEVACGEAFYQGLS